MEVPACNPSTKFHQPELHSQLFGVEVGIGGLRV